MAMGLLKETNCSVFGRGDREDSSGVGGLKIGQLLGMTVA